MKRSSVEDVIVRGIPKAAVKVRNRLCVLILSKRQRQRQDQDQENGARQYYSLKSLDYCIAVGGRARKVEMKAIWRAHFGDSEGRIWLVAADERFVHSNYRDRLSSETDNRGMSAAVVKAPHLDRRYIDGRHLADIR